jgi:hypothetical protein
MQVRDRLAEKLSATETSAAADDVRVHLPTRLKRDRADVRTALLIRLAASRVFALGDRAGALRAAETRSGRVFRLDVRQRVVVKALVSRHLGKGVARGAALAAHLGYLSRSGAGADGAKASFFDREADGVEARDATAAWGGDRHHFRFIVSPEHGDRIADWPAYVRDLMQRVAEDLGEPDLVWFATCHYDTDHPHAHVLVRGRRGDGRDLVIPREYIGHGIRARAQEAAQERLGDLSRVDAERRVWRETQAQRFTGLDRRLLDRCDGRGWVSDGVGVSGAWAALTRGRLRTLEGLGLAVRDGHGFRLKPGMEETLRRLQIQRDVIRTLNQRRLDTGRAVELLPEGRSRGRVTQSGFHDELGAHAYVFVRGEDGLERYGRLRAGSGPIEVGREIGFEVSADRTVRVARGLQGLER